MATILIVDDRPSNRQFLTTLLGYGGHSLLEAADGAQALEQVRARRPDLVITDILMPNMDGYEFVQRVRADSELAHTPVIFYTASYSASQAEALAKSCGVHKVLPKPSEPHVILAAVNEELGARAPTASAPELALPPAIVRRTPDESMTLYLKDLENVKAQFEDIVARGVKLDAGRGAMKELSKKFAQNVASMQRITARLSALLEVGMEMMAERHPARLVELFFAAACDLVESKYAAIGMLDEREQAVRFVFAKGFDAAILRGDAGRAGLLGALLSGHRELRMRSRQGDRAADGLPEGHPPVRDLLALPVASAERVYGWLYFADSRHERGFTEEDSRVATVMTRKLALLYENAMLYDEIQRHAAQMQIEIGERRRTQEALAQSEAGLRRAQLMARLAQVTTGPEGEFESWSETLPRLIGIEPSQMPTSTREWLDLLHPDDRPLFRAKAIGAGAARERADLEYRLRRADGTWIHVRQAMEPLDREPDAAGRSRWFNTLQDVTEERRAEERLRESELRFRQMAENIRDVFFLQNLDSSQMFYISPAYEQIWGRTCESLYANPGSWADAIHPEDLDYAFTQFREGRETGFDYEFRIIRPDGEVRWIRVRGFPILDDAGNPYRTAGLASDITQRKRAADELRESERRFSDMLGKVELLSLMLDRDARITYCNDYLLRLTGWRREEVEGKNWFELFIPPDAAGMKKMFADLIADLPGAWHHENEILTKGGARRLVRWNNSVLRSPAGEVTGTASIGEDITEQKQAEIRIRKLNRVYAVLSGINTLIVRARDRSELFREACRIAVEDGQFRMAWIGVVDHEIGRVKPVASHGDVRGFFDTSPLVVRDGKRPAKGKGLAWRAVQDKRAAISNDVANDPQTAMKNECKERGINSLVMLPLVVAGEGIGVLALYAAETGFFDDQEMKLLVELAGDISFALDHLQKAEKLHYLAYYDELTGLANPTLFHERLAQHVQTAAGANRKFAVFCMDVDRFKSINDAFGRQAGDELLKQIAMRFVRADGGDASRLARIGADDFSGVVIDFESEEHFARVTELKFNECFGPPYRIGDQDIGVSAKLGIAIFPEDGADAATLFRNSEAALKKAKATGERYLFYASEMTERVAEKLSLETKLRQALENDEFVLHYQPKVAVESRKIVGVEALIRWQSRERGLVPPGHFIPLLEETGLIQQVGSWALQRAAADHRGWVEQKLMAPRVAVNVSQIQLRRRDFVEIVEQAIRDGITPTAIDLEITESLVMQDVKANIQKLNALRTLGIEISIDDFGTGYSSLGYLAKLPVQALKIDRSFIITMQDDPNTMTLVSTIISLAHSLHLKVIAEGVETEDQAKFLRLLRCDQMQGYLFSKPVPNDALVALLRKGV